MMPRNKSPWNFVTKEIPTGTQQVIFNIPSSAFRNPFPSSFSDLNTETAIGSNYYAALQFLIKVAFDRSSKNEKGESNLDDIMCDVTSGEYRKKIGIYLEPLFISELGTHICEKHKKNLFELIIDRTGFQIDYERIRELASIRKSFLMGYIKVARTRFGRGSYEEPEQTDPEKVTLKHRALSSIEQLVQHAQLLYLPSSWEAVKLDVFYRTKYDLALDCDHNSEEFSSQYRTWLRLNDLQTKEGMLMMIEDSLFDFVSNNTHYLNVTDSKLEVDDIYLTELNSLLREAISQQKHDKVKDLLEFGLLSRDILAGKICRALGLTSSNPGVDNSDGCQKFSVHYDQLASMKNIAGVRVFIIDRTPDDFQRKIIHQLAINSASMIGTRSFQLKLGRGDRTALRFCKETHQEDSFYGGNFIEAYNDRASTGAQGRSAQGEIPSAFEEEFENSDDEEATAANNRLDDSAAQCLQKLNNQMIEGDIARNDVKLPLEHLHKIICSPHSFFECVIRVAFGGELPCEERPEIFDVRGMYAKDGPLHISNWSTSAFKRARQIGCCASQSNLKNYLRVSSHAASSVGDIITQEIARTRDDFSLQAFGETEPVIEEPQSPPRDDSSSSDSEDSQEERELDAILGNTVQPTRAAEPIPTAPSSLIISPFGIYELNNYSNYDWPSFVKLPFAWAETEEFESACETVDQTSRIVGLLREYLVSDCEMDEDEEYPEESSDIGGLDDLLDQSKLSHRQREIFYKCSPTDRKALVEIICAHPKTRTLLKFEYPSEKREQRSRKYTSDARTSIKTTQTSSKVSMDTNFDVIAKSMAEKKRVLRQLHARVSPELYSKLMDKFMDSSASNFCTHFMSGDSKLSGQSNLALTYIESKYVETFTESFERKDPLLSLQSNFACYVAEQLQYEGLTYNTGYFWDIMKVVVCASSEPLADFDFLGSMLKYNLMIIGQKAVGKTTLLNIVFRIFANMKIDITISSEASLLGEPIVDGIHAFDEIPRCVCGKSAEDQRRVENYKSWLTGGGITFRKKVETNEPGNKWQSKEFNQKINCPMLIIGNHVDIRDSAFVDRFVYIPIGPMAITPHSLILSKMSKNQHSENVAEKRQAFEKYMRYLQVTCFLTMKFLGTCATYYPEINFGEYLLNMAVDCCSNIFPSIRFERRILDRVTQEFNVSTVLNAAIKLHYATNDSGKSMCTQYFDLKSVFSTLWKLCFIDQDTCLRIIFSNMRRYVKELLHELLCVAVNVFTVHKFPYPRGFDETTTREYVTHLKQNAYEVPRIFLDSFVEPDSPVPKAYKIYGENHGSDSTHYALLKIGENEFRDKNYFSLPYTLLQLAKKLAAHYNGKISEEVIHSVLLADLTKTMTCKVRPLELVEMVTVRDEGNRRFPKDQVVLVAGSSGPQYMLKSKLPLNQPQMHQQSHPFGIHSQAASNSNLFGGPSNYGHQFGSPYFQVLSDGPPLNQNAHFLNAEATNHEYPPIELGSNQGHYFKFPVLKHVKNSATTGRVYILAAFVDGDPLKSMMRALQRHLTFANCVPPRLMTLETPSFCDNIRTAMWMGTDPIRVPELTHVAKEYRVLPLSKEFRLLFKDQEAFFALMHFRKCGGDPRKENAFLDTNVYQHRPKEAHKLTSNELLQMCGSDKEKRVEVTRLRAQVVELDTTLKEYDQKYRHIFEKGQWVNHSELSSQLKKLFTVPSQFGLSIDAKTLRIAYWKRLEVKKQLTLALSYYPMQQGKEMLQKINQFSSKHEISQIMDDSYFEQLEREISTDETPEIVQEPAPPKTNTKKPLQKPPPSPKSLRHREKKTSKSPPKKRDSTDIESQLENMTISHKPSLARTVVETSVDAVIDATKNFARGNKAHFIVLDEAAFADPKVVSGTLAPMCTEIDTALFMLTTTLGSSNYFTKMTKMKDPRGGYLFQTVRLGQPCDECIATRDDAWLCPHNQDEKAEWISSEEQRRWSVFYKEMGDQETMKRELYSVDTVDGERMFEDAEIKYLREAPLYQQTKPVKIVSIGIDPGGGTSPCGCVSGFFSGGDLVITSLDALIVSTNLYADKEAHVLAAFEPIRRHKNLSKCGFVIAPEVEPGGNSSEAASIFTPFTNVLVLHEATAMKNPGIIKTLALTSTMKSKLKFLLKTGRVRFHENMITSSFPTPEDAKKELFTQMENFSLYIKNGKPCMNGKRNGHDDMLIALLHLIQGTMLFFTSRDERYLRFRKTFVG